MIAWRSPAGKRGVDDASQRGGDDGDRRTPWATGRPPTTSGWLGEQHDTATPPQPRGRRRSRVAGKAHGRRAPCGSLVCGLRPGGSAGRRNVRFVSIADRELFAGPRDHPSWRHVSGQAGRCCGFSGAARGLLVGRSASRTTSVARVQPIARPHLHRLALLVIEGRQRLLRLHLLGGGRPAAMAACFDIIGSSPVGMSMVARVQEGPRSRERRAPAARGVRDTPWCLRGAPP